MTLYEFVARFNSCAYDIDIEVYDINMEKSINSTAHDIQEYELDNKLNEAYVENWYVDFRSNKMVICVCS